MKRHGWQRQQAKTGQHVMGQGANSNAAVRAVEVWQAAKAPQRKVTTVARLWCAHCWGMAMPSAKADVGDKKKKKKVDWFSTRILKSPNGIIYRCGIEKHKHQSRNTGNLAGQLLILCYDMEYSS